MFTPRNQTTVMSAPLVVDLLSSAGNGVERALAADSSFPTLLETTKVSQHCLHTASGLGDMDYVALDSILHGVNVKQIQNVGQVPLPREISQHIRASHYHSKQGLFPDIHRAWMTIDSDLYLWSYDQGVDTAYYDRLAETIVGVALVKPRQGVFQPFVRRLLVVVTCVEVVILGVTFSPGPAGTDLLNLIPDAVYHLSLDNSGVTTTVGTDDGRIFQGGDDGCLFEILYKGNDGWFGKSCKRINHSQGMLSLLVPAFLTFSEKDSIVQLVVDNSRGLLYALSSKGTISAYLLGQDPGTVTQLASISESQIVQQAVSVVRTLDGSTFKPIVHIQALETSESSSLHLVAVTSSGARLYMTTHSLASLVINNAQWVGGNRPQGLHLVHVRMPPGYTAGASQASPQHVYQALHHRGTLLMVQQRGEQSTIACLSRDLLPSATHLAETESRLQLDDRVMQIAEEPNLASNSKEPLLVTQHMETQAKYAVLSSNGVNLLAKQRPSDIMKATLLASGPEGQATRALFSFLGEDQACATALILACFESSPNVVDAATRAFLLLGSERRQLAPSAQNTPVMFNPSSVSTPIRVPNQLSNAVSGVSGRHEGMYLLVSRILRPLWSVTTCRQMPTDNKKVVLTSNCDADLLAAACTYLEAVSAFLKRNLHLLVRSNQNDTITDAEEKKSLEALKHFVCHALEVLGLWHIVCEHQLHVLAPQLPADLQLALTNTTFKELLLSGQEICGALLGALIGLYLSDNASIDAISAKLRSTCPSLFRSEDAASAKAKQLLQQAQHENNSPEKNLLLTNALKLLQEAAPHVDLPSVCQQLLNLQCYDGIVRVCTACAKAEDPYDMGLKHYLNELPAEETVGADCLRRRMDTYKEAVNSLDKLYNQPEGHLGGRMLLQSCLKQSDALLRESVFEWLLRKGLMQSELLQRAEPTPEGLEAFLQRLQLKSRTDGRDDRNVSELLWTLYEKTGRHAMAASVLHKAATAPEPHMQLQERIYCLSRALLCLRSSSAGYSQSTGLFSKELEDQLDVAKLQIKVLEEVQKLDHDLSPAQLERLEQTLLTITDLFQHYAVPLQLWECQLAILQCSNHEDPNLVNDIWHQMIASTRPLNSLLSRVEAVGKHLQSHLFPIEVLAKEIEAVACRDGTAPGTVALSLVKVSGLESVMAAYEKLLRQPDWSWGAAGDEHYLMKSAAFLLGQLAEVQAAQRRNDVVVLALDMATSCLNQLYTKTCVEELIGQFRRLQSLFKTML
ncbi:nuclear pore complex protein Nup154 [Neocloeon triangulifer]|uniref:nuclear pore complex protein Nup154 n=1 Tax=Neocloeon triangulifer TaxID=2078957 RepID=UPI00286EEED0|nr:nuclear pore complex protein Nup154 [Neocloeon triangulifer]